jgi:hypothetical protein
MHLRSRITLIAAMILAATLPAAASGPPAPLATRSLMLEGGGRIEVGTRYHLADYRTGDLIRIDPVLGNLSTRLGVDPSILSSAVRLRPHGFAPCLANETETQSECVEGTQPALLPDGTPSSFGFSFLRLFNTAEADGTVSPNWFGYASFVVTLGVRASDGAEETIHFPLTVTVQQSEMDLTPPERPAFPATTGSILPGTYPFALSLLPPLKDRLTATQPLQ